MALSTPENSWCFIDMALLDDLYEHHRFTVDKGQEPLRLDKFLVSRLADTSRNRIQHAARAGCILVNGTPKQVSYKVKPADIISVVLPFPPRFTEVVPEKLPLEIVFEDNELIVINKPAGMVVHPGVGNHRGTLVNGLLFHFQQLPVSCQRDGELRPGLVHRLDKNTTGLMVVAKTEWALTHLARQFYDRTVRREYLALIWGTMPSDAGTLTGHIGRSTRNRKIMTVFPEGDKGKNAVTHYRVKERLGPVTLVTCTLETGRTHQIRIHFSHYGHPVFNDPDYGGDRIRGGQPRVLGARFRQFLRSCFNELPRQALHARTLGFIHPVTRQSVYFESPLPPDMALLLERWRDFMGL